MNGSGLLHVIVPMKPAYEGKSRLSSVLDLEDRAALCLILLQHVLQAVSNATTDVQTWVVGGDEWVHSVTLQESAQWQADPGGGLNEVIRYATRRAFQAGAPAILVLPGDLGLLEAGDVDNLVALSRGLRCAVLAKATADGGTNAILAPSGLMVGPHFGANSFTQHMEAARSGNVPIEVLQAPGLGFDLDTPEDLAAYQKHRPDLVQTLASWRHKLRTQTAGSTD